MPRVHRQITHSRAFGSQLSMCADVLYGAASEAVSLHVLV